MPNDSQLNCNYRFCRREPTTKPSDRFLCFYTPAVVTVVSARVKMPVSKERSEGVTCFHCVRSAFVFSLHVANLWLLDCFLFRVHFLIFKECPAHPGGALKSRVDGRPGDHCIQSWGGGVGCGGEKLVSQQSLLNEVN